MLDAQCFVELDRLWDQVGVELVEVVVEQCGEVLWQVLRFLQAGSESIS